MSWTVYILKCSNDSYYVGHTENLEARIKLHNSGKGSKHTAKYRPASLIYQETATSKQIAMKREAQIKHWSRAKKEALISKDNKTLKKLSKCRNLHAPPNRAIPFTNSYSWKNSSCKTFLPLKVPYYYPKEPAKAQIYAFFDEL